MTKEQLAVFLWSCLNSVDKLPPSSDANPSYMDWDTVSEWSKEAVYQLAESGVISCEPDNLLSPKAWVTRAEFAAIMQRFITGVVE